MLENILAIAYNKIRAIVNSISFTELECWNLSMLYGIPIENFLELIVTFNINTDFASERHVGYTGQMDDLSLFIEFANAPENS